MARDHTVKVSEEELSALHEARNKLYFSESVPYGEVIKELAGGPDVYLDNSQSGGPKISISYNGGRYYVGRVFPRCDCDSQDMIYWEFGDGSEPSGCNTAENLADQPNRDRIDLTTPYHLRESPSIDPVEDEDEEEYSTIPCGCGDFEVLRPTGSIIPSIDVVCPECGNHFGHDE